MAITWLQIKDGTVTSLAASVASDATTIEVADATVCPTVFPYRLTIWVGTYAAPRDDPACEVVEVTAADGNTLTVTRAQEDTTAQTHAAGKVCAILPSASIFAQIQDAIDGLPVSAPATTAENTLQPSAATAVPLTLKGHATQSADLFTITTSADAALLTVDADGDVTLGDAQDVAVGTTTGSKIGTSAAQKLGLWGATPVVQPAAAAQAVVTLGNADSEIGGLTISAAYDQTEVQALRDKCEELADDVRNLSALVHALRTALVDTGIVKGAA